MCSSGETESHYRILRSRGGVLHGTGSLCCARGRECSCDGLFILGGVHPCLGLLFFYNPHISTSKDTESMGACYRGKKINFQPNYLEFLSDLVFHSQHLPWAERQVTINFSPDATVLMTQTVTKTQGLCIKHAWLNFNLQKANVRPYRSRKTRADLLGEKNKETQRYHKKCAFEMMYEPGACSASMRSWVRTPRTHINTWCTNPIIAPTVRWKSEKRDFQKPRSQLTWPWSTKEQTPQKLCLRQGGRQGRATPKLFSELTHTSCGMWEPILSSMNHEHAFIYVYANIYTYTPSPKKKNGLLWLWEIRDS